MPSYVYEAIDEAGAAVSGDVDASSEVAAAEKVRRMGYTPVKLQPVRRSLFSDLLQYEKPVSLGDLGLFTRQLASMLNAGIPLIRALYALGEQSSNPTLKKVVAEIADSVEAGSGLSEAMKDYPQVFSDMYTDMIRAGEVGGNLVDVLGRLAEQTDKDKSLRDNIRSATIYPVAVVAFATVILLAMMFFIVPIFVDMFPEGVALPLPTHIIITFSNSLRTVWYLYLVAALVVGFGFRSYMRSERGKRGWDRMRFQLPVFGALFQKITLARFCRTLATLLGGGIQILEALETAGPTSGSIQMEESVEAAGERVQQGESLTEPLRENALFPPMVTMMVAIGEETGELPNLLNRVAEFYEMEVDTMTRGLTSLIEPILIIVVGGMVAVMVIALYLPLFTVITQIG